MKVLFLEPFYGGSHKVFADGLIRHSCHTVDLVSLPARFWKWRMRGAALFFFSQIPDVSGYDALITTDLMSLADLKALYGRSCPPAMVYFHESQLTYPLSPGERMDLQYGFTDMTTALSAERVVFNSRSHRDAFFKALPEFIRKMPRIPAQLGRCGDSGQIRRYLPGMCFSGGTRRRSGRTRCHPPDHLEPPLGIRQESDRFFSMPWMLPPTTAMIFGWPFWARISSRRRRFSTRPGVVSDIALCSSGRWLRGAPTLTGCAAAILVISTALQENFGIAVVEAIGLRMPAAAARAPELS